MSKDIVFLRIRAEREIRKQISNILESYNHYWDILAELAQNAVDALIERKRIEPEFSPQIGITFDCRRRRIVFADNGIGVERRWLGMNGGHSTILTPDVTHKEGNKRLVGSKGVGLTYVTFTGNKLTLKSRRVDRPDESPVLAQCVDANRWLASDTSDVPKMSVDDINAEDMDHWSTIVEVDDISSDVTSTDAGDLFDLSHTRLDVLLRTRTAIGWTHSLFEGTPGLDDTLSESLNAKVTLTYLPKRGRSKTIELPFGFLTPDKLFKIHMKRECVEFNDFLRLVAGQPRKAKGKLVSYRTVLSTPTRKVAAYVLIAPSRRLWREIVDEANIKWEGDDGSSESDIMPGIWLATRGMPCGIQLTSPTGVPGWFDWLYILIEDQRMSFDVGRKAPAGRAKSMYTRIARSIVNELRKVRLFDHMKDRPDSPPGKGQLSRLQQLLGKTPLSEAVQKKSGFILPPDKQEAAVAGMFFHLVGAGELPGYRFLRSSYYDTYDVVLRFQIDEKQIQGAKGVAYRADDIQDGQFEELVVAEFKYSAERVIDDVKADKKRFEHFKIIVCWTFDRKVFEREGVVVEKIDDDERLYSGCNYQLFFHSLLGSDDPKLLLVLSEFMGIDAQQFT